MTDHYDPRNKTISLSEGVHSSASVAAIAIAAHEAGHALQYNKKYVPIRVRGAMVPVLNVVSSLAVPLLFIGLMMRFTPLITYAAWAFFALFNAQRFATSDGQPTGAVYGQLAGAFYGFKSIPPKWRDMIAHKDMIADFAVKLWLSTNAENRFLSENKAASGSMHS